MKNLFLCHRVAICASAILLSSCGALGQPLDDTQPPINAPRASSESSYAFAVLYSFKRGAGVHPASGVIADGKTMYGTTVYGDDMNCNEGCGTVYSITNTGRERLVHRFENGTTDGHYPVSALTLADGVLYGTTLAGGSGTVFQCGSSGCGTVFALSRSGKETILHSFTGGFHDGEAPEDPVLVINDVVYGSTRFGGPWGAGTIFAASTTGTETVLYDFTGQPHDGSGPSSPLVDIDGRLYGTTAFGGTKNLGTVFSITTSGTETVVHTFKGGTRDGALPRSLIDVNGTLFGTTGAGGSSVTCL